MTMEEMPAIKPESSLRTRLKSALIFGPVVLFLLYVGGFPFSAMMAFAGLMGGFEWARMVTIGQNPPRLISRLSAFVVGVGVLCAGMVRQPDGSVDNPAIAFSLLLALTFVVYAYNFYHRGPSMRQVVPGLLYIGLSLDVMVWIRNGMDNGLYHMLTLLCIVWASDIFAYFTGRAIGGPRLAPKISPKKTWAGFIGSSIGAGLFAAGLACPWILNAAGVETLGGMGAWGYAVMGAVLAMFGQAGDLLISMFKRHYNIKDTGDLIPGHGGILDRIDALLLVALVFGIIARLAG